MNTKQNKKLVFFVEACWDDETKTYYSKTNITGLFINTATLEEFESVIDEYAMELIFENNLSPQKIAEIQERLVANHRKHTESSSYKNIIPSLKILLPSQLAC